MVVNCKFNFYYEEETHNRVQDVLSRVSNNQTDIEMVQAINDIVRLVSYFSERFNVPKIIFEVKPDDNIYPIYNTLQRSVKVSESVQNFVVPNKSTININVEEEANEDIKLPEIPIIPKQEESSND